jgi:hypothetical protein
MTGRLVVDCSYGRWEKTLRRTWVAITVDGIQSQAGWGPWMVDVAPGVHRVEVVTLWGKRGLGPASLDVAVAPGAATTVYYRAPGTKGVRGAIGLTPQKTPAAGWWLVWLMLVLVTVSVGLPLLLTR